MTQQEVKYDIIQLLVKLENFDALLKIRQFLKESEIDEFKGNNKSDEDYDANKLSFEQWNKQFEGNQNLDEFIPEYGMILRDYRKMIYESEKSATITYEQLGKNIQQWKNE